MWLALKPCLFESDHVIATRALRLILRHIVLWLDQKEERRYSKDFIAKKNFRNQPESYAEGIRSLVAFINLCHGETFGRAEEQEENEIPNFCVRRVRVPRLSLDSVSGSTHATSNSIILWIQPPQYTLLEYTWQGLLIRWENLLIQAQSFTGYLATLGGGFFLCHHFQTALVLAKQQQRFALFLSNESMYYGCLLNQIYNFIYAGYFSIASKLLRNVSYELTSKKKQPDAVLMEMCNSAKLFLKRMRKASQTINSVDSSGNISKTIDDYKRIRVVHHDQSRREDLIQPFQRRT